VSVEDVQAGLSFYRSRAEGDFSSDEATASEAAEFYNRVIADGRYVAMLESDPAEAARRLDMSVSEECVALIDRVVNASRDDGRAAISPGGVVVAVVIVLVFIARAPEPEEVVIDASGRLKL
jgi:hypothetical protein